MSSVKYVRASGPCPCDLMIIGEAPGEQEDIQGVPFVGRSGKLLDKMLAHIKRDRSNVYVTNIVKVRPEGNRTPTPEEIGSWRHLVIEEIIKVKPKSIMTLGNCATKAMIKTDETISKLRGQLHRLHINEDIALIPTYHPSYILRKSNDETIRSQVRADLELAASYL